jgi:2,5-diketo-D-gluconate reductase A
MSNGDTMVPSIRLNSGATMPQIGFGVFRVDPDDTQRVVEEALEVGYRHIDTATGYDNERQVGAAIRALDIPRDEIFVTTKLRNDHHKSQDVRGAFQRSLEMLGLDYVDLYLIHWPLPLVDRYVDTWRIFAEFSESGEAKSIGVSNFLEEHLERLFEETRVVPAVNQVELHLIFQQPALRAFHQEHGIATEAWGPLGQGTYDLLGLPSVQKIAARHGVQPVQVALRWHLQTGNIFIPKSSSKERMRQNLDLFGFVLSEEEMATLDGLDENRRVAAHPLELND